ncbi:MAG TPA: argininosuccinate lyase [Dehalococcoidia bacterium]|nr:argininosuccinate lyase [Dehalococcoidia bacterium]
MAKRKRQAARRGQAAASGSDARGADKKLWGGRFEKSTNPLVESYTTSVAQDLALLPYDIAGSIAHARMLGRTSIIPRKDADTLVRGLEELAADVSLGTFRLDDSLEDVHMNVEAALTRKVGPVAGKLHTARSRNDQVATDFRMLVRESCELLLDDLIRIRRTLLELAREHRTAIMPGYTHLQRAQPILFSHHLLAYFEMFERDEQRLWSCHLRVNVCPLGSGALAGVPYPIDRDFTAAELGFEMATANSIDAVSDRDFVLEFQSCVAIAMMHCSRLAEEIVLWSSAEFGFITLDDAYATGSSIMPQKKNADVAELARGRTGRVYGNLMALLTVMKGLPLSYNRDLQEDRQGFLDSLMTLSTTLQVFSELLGSMTLHVERMELAATANYALATDVADYLAKKGIPFREAHEAVGRLVRYAEQASKDFGELSLDEYRQFSAQFDADVFAINALSAVSARDVYGGTAPGRVFEQIAEAEERLKDSQTALDGDTTDAAEDLYGNAAGDADDDELDFP